MGLFSGSFGKGLVTGLAESVERGILDDMDRLKEDTSRLAKIRYERGLRAKEDYDATMKENLEIIRDMEKKMGSADAVQFMIDQYGFGEAQNLTAQLFERQKNSGGVFKASEALGLEMRGEGETPVTAMQLAKFVTPSYSISEGTASGYKAPGFMSLFGADPSEEITASSNRMLAEAGVPLDSKTSIQDMPSAVKGRGIREWEVYALDDPARDAARLRNLAKETYVEGHRTGDKDKIAEATEMMSLAEIRLGEATSLQNLGKQYDEVDIGRSINAFSGVLGTAVGMGKSGSYESGQYINNQMSNEQMIAVTAGAQALTDVASQARAAGVSPAVISDYMYKAALNNATLSFTSSDSAFVDGGTFSIGEVNSLIDTSLFTGSGGVNPQGGTGGTGPSTSSTTVTTPKDLAGAIASNKGTFQNTNDPNEKTKIINRILRLGKINPQTNKPYTASEIEQMLSM